MENSRSATDEDSSEDEVVVIHRNRKRSKKRTVLDYDSDEEFTADCDASSSGHAYGTRSRSRTNNQQPAVIVVTEDSVSRSPSEDVENELRREQNKADGKRRRRILGDDELEESTRRAMDEEAARQRRLVQRQSRELQPPAEDLPDLPDLSNSSDVVLTSTVIFEREPESGKPLLQVHPELAQFLKSHQTEANHFLYQAVCESAYQLNDPDFTGSGCIVAHCMGLGKTLTTIAFLHTLLTNWEVTGIQTCLVLAPLNAHFTWITEFARWSPQGCGVKVYDLASVKQMTQRALKIREWRRTGGVLVVGYTLYRLLVLASEPPERDGPKSWKKLSQYVRDSFYEGLLNPGPDIVVCDEGHVLKSELSALSQVIRQIRTRRRIVLTGTPLQNNLMEYHCMVSFVKPGLLGTSKEFANRFANPIKKGESNDSTPEDYFIMKRRISVLTRLLSGFVHRRGFEYLRRALPPKYEYVVMLRLTPEQSECYTNYLRDIIGGLRFNNEMQMVAALRRRLFGDFHCLRYVCSHPCLLYVALKRAQESENREMGQMMRTVHRRLEDGAEASETDDADSDSDREFGFLADGDGDAEEAPVDDDEAGPSTGRRLLPIVRDPRQGRVGRRMMLETSPTWFTSVVDENCVDNYLISSKLLITMELLHEFEAVGDKTLIFSQSLLFLDLIEKTLAREQARRCSAGADLSRLRFTTWQPGVDFFRIDGRVSAEQRNELINRFNAKGNERGRLFLISTRAGGMGINMVAANRCIMLDISWNPAHDAQAVFRTYRFGQVKPVYVYRLVAAGTMEEKIYDRQVLKQALARRVVDDKQIRRHFSENEIRELYTFDASINGIRPGNLTFVGNFKVPKDTVFAELLRRRPDVVKSYLDHDSLLAHQEAEVLSEAERLIAWREFECEKQGFRVDARNPALSHRHIQSVMMDHDSTLSGEEASQQALVFLRDKFADLSQPVHEYVMGLLKNSKAGRDKKPTEEDPSRAASATRVLLSQMCTDNQDDETASTVSTVSTMSADMDGE